MKTESRRESGRVGRPENAAKIFEIATHLEFEALALAWAIRNRQIYMEGLDRSENPSSSPTRPFGMPDPTCGATHFHRHDEPPPNWAVGEPIALIGAYLFYDLRDAPVEL